MIIIIIIVLDVVVVVAVVIQLSRILCCAQCVLGPNTEYSGCTAFERPENRWIQIVNRICIERERESG